MDINKKCMLCNMKINKNNYNINKMSFLHQNNLDDSMFCPFCGAPSEYIAGPSDNLDIWNMQLDNNTLDILDKAMKLEMFNYEFYREAEKLAQSQNLIYMFNALGNIEFMHAKIHKRLFGHKDLPILHKPNYEKYDSDEKLLKQAWLREEHAIKFYKRYYDNLCNDKLRDIFNVLIGVEQQHMVLTNK
ncbi:ferritin family protein [Clostridiisalibacter paucivorans]|uniref:ferritin family protein n=1 Tax=Clostridiisalibacter paucivorans TaxID=408753 RepID=UPI0006854051|nr:ferritin family protein [Clostridiisalibacter paucivorans]